MVGCAGQGWWRRDAPTYRPLGSTRRRCTAGIAGGSTAPDPLAPDRLAPDRLAADRLAADRLAADRLAPDRLAPYRLAPDRLAPDPLAPDPLAAQLVEVLSPVDASGVTAGILARLRNDGHLPPEPLPDIFREAL